MFKLRMIGKILRQARLGHVTIVFAIIFVLCALGISVVSPEIGGFGNALWLCFQSVTTIGFGDLPTDRFAVRVLLVLLSVVSVFYLAVITGVVVAYCTEMVRSQAEDSVMRIADDLENLEEKTPEELKALSDRVKAYRIGR